MNNYFILHGSFGSPFGNWFPWLASEIEKNNKTDGAICYVPHFPTGIDKQSYENWESVLNSYLSSGLINENSVIFAHSIAPVFVCKFLIKYNIKVKRLVFVCGFNNYVIDGAENYNYVNKTMFCEGLEKIKDLCDDIVCFYSSNDPYVDFEEEDRFAGLVANKKFIIKNGGHLNAESGFDKFPELLKFIG